MVEESTVAAEQIKEQADRLAEAVDSFTVGEGERDGRGDSAGSIGGHQVVAPLPAHA
ncbi:hypothetical protein QLQ86_18625 [Halomonas sp. LR5S13]|uniref:hypothetical protein n=1 Tax=Halomonas rhizosphaerae TaxID=3043296 RepID=UPI0024A809C2|nr:hypothetical protein [Halomonas rhizosphaerae]MDI5922783.1 hypothetical protein [Halomonas rhizosphaerae]